MSPPEPGVRCLEPDCGDELVHRYAGGDYGLEEIPELFQVGRLETGDDGAERLILEPGEVRELKILADAYSFDFDEGLIELCIDLHRFAIERGAPRFVFAADF